uniref:Mitogen-activated protein kinase kinase kinase 14a n=1 Tax=Oncorhynchus mykiss TaxID=8022 RepID=A0A8K9XZF2_ONCMY
MAVNQRIFNSTRPFSGSPQIELKGSYPSLPSPDDRTSDEEGKESEGDFMACLKPRLIQVLTQGTAEQVGEAGPLNYQKNSFIAQAECETQDSQQFSPSCSERSYVGSPNCLINRDSSEHNNVACSTAASNQDKPGSRAHCSPRKKPRKNQKRKEKKEEQRETGKQRQRRRVPSGVPEQETQTGSSPQLIQTQEDASEPLSNISTSYSSSIPSLEAHDTRRSPYPLQDCNRGPSHSHPCWGPQVFSPSCNLSTYGQESDSDSPLSSVGDCSLALAGLRGSVSQEDRCYAGPFCKDVERHVWEKEGEVSETDTNEGLIFNKNIQPVNYEYREGKDYSLCKSINTGSYGEVHSVQDNRTHFRFCAKKILLKSFSSEEVGTWSALKSPRVVELFGVIREGPYVVLFMDLKAGSVGQLIKERGRLPEDLALHYHCQVLEALEHLLKRRVLHLDIKDLKGTETHMAPEIVKGETRGAKADVWSSCCMLLHMLNGCQPWTRYYSRPLYFKIANEPPPLREIPPDCSPFTADVIKVGLQKEPTKRASASELKGRAARALREVGGLISPIRGSYKEPLQIDDSPGQSSQPWPPFSRDTCSEENHKLLLESMNPGSRELNNDEEEEGSEADTEETTSPPDSPRSLLTQLHEWQNPKMADVTSNVSELELRKLEREFYLTSLSQLHSAETQEQLLSCLSSSDCYSNRDLWDRKDSGRWSISPGDDLSSGVFSYNSQPDGQILSMDWLVHQSHLSPPRCFEGVDVCITDVNGQSIRIREKRRVKVGHIATGISDQISERVFTMETQEREPVAHDEEVQDSGLLLRCVPAPDYSQAWRWRVKEGVLETRD